jgi:hypothetical protein
MFVVTDGTAAENGFAYCVFCGGELKAVEPTPEPIEDET